MERMESLPAVLTVALLAAVCATTLGQAVKETSSTPYVPQEKPIPASVRLKPYFSDSPDPRRPDSIEFRTVDQMTEKDRLQAANAESSIGEHTRYTGLEFNQGQWSYQQVVCPALPNHIFLRFLRNNGTGDVSLFTASIPRGDEGRVRIIPIQLRGYSLFSPAPINAMTISAFNQIRTEENPDRDPEWLGTGLCYAALAGAHPQVAPATDDPAGEKFPLASKALLQVLNGGGAVLSFTDVSATPRPMEWTMTFDRKVRLAKAGHSKAEMYSIAVEHPVAVDQIGKPMPIQEPKVKTYNPPTPGVVPDNPAPPAQTIDRPR